jgi:hypothetical protein
MRVLKRSTKVLFFDESFSCFWRGGEIGHCGGSAICQIVPSMGLLHFQIKKIDRQRLIDDACKMALPLKENTAECIVPPTISDENDIHSRRVNVSWLYKALSISLSSRWLL